MVAINLEGCGVFCTPYRRDLAFVNMIIALSKMLSRKVVIINGMLSYCPQTEKNEKAVAETSLHFNNTAGVFLRDPTSVELANSIGIEARYVPDALFVWAKRYEKVFRRGNYPFYEEMFDSFPETVQRFYGTELPKGYVCISGASFHPLKDTSGYPSFFSHLIRELRDLPLVLVAPGGDYFLEEVARSNKVPFIPGQGNILVNAALLAGAKAYISGRYHPSIMAALGGTPSVFLESNSHKTKSLQRVLSYGTLTEHRIIDSMDVIERIKEDLYSKLGEHDTLRLRLKEISNKCAETLSSLSTLIKESIAS